MYLREKLNQNKGVSFAIGVAILLGAAVFLWRSLGDGAPPALTQAYYTDDEGKTFFPDDINKLYPFDHNGKQAYYAGVYQCGPNGKPFVVYLKRWSEKGLAEVTPLLAKANEPQVENRISEIRGRAMEVKKLGEVRWVPEASGAGGAVMSPTCPDGGTDSRVVFP